MKIYKNIDVITLFALASFLISIAFDNTIGIVAFGGSTLWCAFCDFKGRDDRYHTMALNIATILFMLNAGYNAYAFWDSDIIRAIAQFLTLIGAGLNIIGNVLVEKMKRDSAFLKSFETAFCTMLANPGFWYALNIILVGVVALLFNSSDGFPVFSTSVIIVATIAGMVAVYVSTLQMRKAQRGEIKVEDINDGRSNMWIARSNSITLIVVIIGLVKEPGLTQVAFLMAQCLFIYGHYRIAKTINDTILFLRISRQRC